MSIYIESMEMPTRCAECRLSTVNSFNDKPLCDVLVEYMSYKEWEVKRLDNCPLVSIPPHGRLGDLDKLENGLRHMAKYQHGERQQGILGCCETIRTAPTIIEASGEGVDAAVKEET